MREGGQQRAQRHFVEGVGAEELEGVLLGGGPVARARGGLEEGVAQPAQPLVGGCDLGCGPPGVALVGQRPAAGEGDARRGRRARRDQCAVGELAFGLDGVLRQGIEVEPVETEPVAGIRPLNALRSEDAPEPADEHGELVRRPRRRGVSPQALHQMVHADRAPVVERQDLEQRALLAPPERSGVTTLDPELAQQPYPQALHALILARGQGTRWCGRPCSGSEGRRVPGPNLGVGPGVLTCVAVEGRLLQADDAAGLRDEAVRAGAEGCGVVLLGEGPLGDPVVLAAGLSPSVPEILLGVRLTLSPAGRHPAVIARELTSLDLVCGGRSVLCFTPPFDDRLAEAIALCRAMWRDGEASSDGPHFPVAAAVNRPGPAGPGSPKLALDLDGRRGAHRARSPVRSTCSFTRPATPGCAAWSARDGRDARARARRAQRCETTAVSGRHLPALNGLRGVAVLGVVAYHLQLGWASGGYLGVDLFFVLSGFLITTLLLEEWAGAGRISLAAFWGRRARRLLPALFLVVGALGLYLVLNGAFGGPGANGLVDLSGLRGDAISTLLYVNNWHSIFAHQSYFAQFSAPSPLQHTWSLAIEEQFYLVWPLVILLVFRFARRAWRSTGLVLAVSLGLASSILMAVLFTPGAGVDPTRVYYGTDTRLFDLMAGATLAFVAAARPQPNLRARRRLHVVGPLAAAALAVFWVTAGTPTRVAHQLHVRREAS